MSQTEIKITQQEKPKKHFWQSIADKLSHKPLDTLKDSDRFSRLGLLPYPTRQQLEYRLGKLTSTLAEIEVNFQTIVGGEITDSEQRQFAFIHISKLFSAFMEMAAPWCQGLDDERMAVKVERYSRLSSGYGYLPSMYPTLKWLTETLINFSWRVIHTIPDTPVLMETRATIEPIKKQPLTMSEWEEIGNKNREATEQ